MPAYPQIFRIRQKFNDPQLEDIAGSVENELMNLQLTNVVSAGQSVAISAGSRGITNIDSITRAVVDHVRRLGAQPFIVPAMGSHGGGTAEGQRRILESYGVTEEFCGCPIRSSMETRIVCHAAEGFPVHFDATAFAADHVIVCNRVKPHTSFVGDIESGLMKMMLIGLGKHAGAKVYHRAIRDFSFGQIVRSVAREVVARCSIVAGLGIVENSYGETSRIRAIAPDELELREKELLLLAKQWMPRLPFDAADILLVDEIGKNISGSGLDVNVVGRKDRCHQASPDINPRIKMIAIRDLSVQTHGSAVGIGLSEFCRSRAIEKMNIEMTRINVQTGGYPAEAMLPLDYPTDREMIDVMLPQIGLADPPDAKLLWIKNTKSIAELECGTAYWRQAQERNDLEVISELRDLPFDEDGNLPDRL
ncbi:MAG: lactate racemase domain-containing protein [Fuerstiella sp.]|nr:lactate racemase domain-containing protein [Fuerstiella sp.]